MSDLITATVFALREANAVGWQMLVRECTPEELGPRLAHEGMGGQERRVVGTALVSRGRLDGFLVDRAWKDGWHRDGSTGLWLPLEDPLSPLPGSPTPADLSLSLGSIMNGSIGLIVEVDGRRHELFIDDYDDSLLLLVRFVRNLAEGGQPHGALADRARSHFVVQDGPRADLCRLYVNIEGERERQRIDVIVVRRRLLDEFRRLALDIASHPFFAHHFVCHCCIPDDEYDRVDAAAEREWARGVAEHRFAEVGDAAEAFVAAKIAEIPLPPDCARLAADYRRMLMTLEIPDGWSP